VDLLAEKLDAHPKKPPFKRFLIGKARAPGGTLFLVKPLTFMNCSGEPVAQLLRYTGCTTGDMIVVCDSLDLPVGVCRLRRRGASAGQKGLESIIENVKSQEFMRLAIGIGRPPSKEQVVGYVLGVPRGEEQRALDRALGRAAEGILRLCREEPEKVMNELNRADE